MTIPASRVLATVQEQLNDAGVHWTLDGLILDGNTVCREIANLKPDAAVRDRPILLQPGAYQSLPPDALRLLKLQGNLSGSGYMANAVSPASLGATISSYLQFLALGQNRYLALYRDDGNGGVLTAQAVTQYDGAVLPGVETQIGGASVLYVQAALLPDGRVLAAYVDDSDGDLVKALFLTINPDNSVRSSDPVILVAGPCAYLALALTGSNRFLIAYQDQGNNSYATCQSFIYGQSGITSLGSAVLQAAGTATWLEVVRLSGSKALVLWADSSNSGKGTAVAVALSPTAAPVVGAPVAFSGAAAATQIAALTLSPSAVCVVFQSGAANGIAVVLSVAGTVVTVNTPTTLKAAALTAFGLLALNPLKLLVSFSDPSNSGAGSAIEVAVNPSTLALTAGAVAVFDTGAATYCQLAAVSPTQAIVFYAVAATPARTAQQLEVPDTAVIPDQATVFPAGGSVIGSGSNFLASVLAAPNLMIVAYVDGTGKGQAIAIQCDGAKFTIGAAFNFSAADSVTGLSLTKLAEGVVLVSYLDTTAGGFPNCMALQVNLGTLGITAGSALQVLGAACGLAGAAAIGQNQALAFYRKTSDGFLYANVVTAAGTALTLAGVETAIENAQQVTATNNGLVVKPLSPGLALILYSTPTGIWVRAVLATVAVATWTITPQAARAQVDALLSLGVYDLAVLGPAAALAVYRDEQNQGQGKACYIAVIPSTTNLVSGATVTNGCWPATPIVFEPRPVFNLKVVATGPQAGLAAFVVNESAGSLDQYARVLNVQTSTQLEAYGAVPLAVAADQSAPCALSASKVLHPFRGTAAGAATVAAVQIRPATLTTEIHHIDRDAIRNTRAAWQSDPPGLVPLEYVFDPKEPLAFWVHPPVDVTAPVFAQTQYVRRPQPVPLSTDPIPYDAANAVFDLAVDSYEQAIVAGLLSMAFAKDDEAGNMAKAAKWESDFQGMLTNKATVDAAANQAQEQG